MDLERQGKRERIVKVEAAPGIPFDNGRYELVLEPLEAGDATMLGVDLKEVLTLKAERQSVWDAAEIERRLEVKDRDEAEPTGQGGP
jgi:hypothetical protein